MLAESPRGRPREFDEDAALTAAMRVFWVHGYARASISVLLEAMGISRASLYATFGDKEQLFRKVMDLYGREKTAYMHEVFDQPTARGVAEKSFAGILALQANKDDPRGCMGIVHSVGHAPGDESVRAYVMERSNQWMVKLIERIELGQKHGDFSADIDARSLALSLKAACDGVLLAASNGVSQDDLNGMVRMFLAMWPGR